MQQLKSGDRVKLNPEVLEDQSRKSLQHSFKRIIDQDQIGVVMEVSELERFPGRWVKFAFEKIALRPEQVIVL